MRVDQHLPFSAQPSPISTHVLCDFDGTIALLDVTDALLERFAPPAWREIEAQWLAGAFGSRECMARQVGLLQASLAELNNFLDSVPIDPAFGAFAQLCQSVGSLQLSVVSDGLDYAIQRILSRHGLGHLRVLANRLVPLGPQSAGRYRLESPHQHSDCRSQAGTCKCALANPAAAGNIQTVLIGDGTSDFCAAQQVDFVFAKDQLLAHCKARGIAHQAFNDFAGLIPHFARITQGTAVHSGALQVS